VLTPNQTGTLDFHANFASDGGAGCMDYSPNVVSSNARTNKNAIIIP
jgi:hypothetical protein